MCAAFVVLGRAGFWARASDTRLFRWGTWYFAALTAISALVNFASQSRWETFIWGPIARILAVLVVRPVRRASPRQAAAALLCTANYAAESAHAPMGRGATPPIIGIETNER